MTRNHILPISLAKTIAGFTVLAALAGTASADGPVNLVYRTDFAVDSMAYDPASGEMTQHFAGNLYVPTVVGGNQLISITDDTELMSSPVQGTVDGTWYFDPSQMAGVDPSNPPPVVQIAPDSAWSHVRFAFKDGSVFEMDPASQPTLSLQFGLGNSGSDGSYDFIFTETTVMLKETSGKGRYAGMVGTYTFQNAVKIVGPNFQVHSRGIALLSLKNPS